MNAPGPETIIAFVRSFGADRALRLKAITFASIGIVNTIVDFGLFSFGHLYIGLPIVPANLLSWTVAVTGSFVMKPLITFSPANGPEPPGKPHARFNPAQGSGLV